ncbi:S8 family serine peptidase [Rhizobium sp. LC145]|uniref:S8 family peptidase n=1 Tax=Rhizobium sp. LC145 TaxID=1120688 RepID=UPI00062A4982|nr:S8 family serine peptidase [Rhizobium sp. LC145]KKX31548.1 protease [Rhizobium sp. LC145]TKT66784.1 protease [Rhizobiaceae bacterium LC148]
MVTSPVLENQRPIATGAMIVALRDDADLADCVRIMERQTESEVSVSTFGGQENAAISADKVTFFPELQTAFIPRAIAARHASRMIELVNEEAILEARPEFFVFLQQQYVDSQDSTWGIAAVGAHETSLTGEGIKIAVLDTGIDLKHPDFAERTIVTQSFVAGETVNDQQGHGTHCAGTAAGKAVDPGVPRYGVAPDASLFVGKILNNRGFGTEGDIINGMNWAIGQKCEVISMSVGGPVRPGERHSLLYERIGKLALRNGSLIVAAAGNESNRSLGFIAPVASPANAPSILAVGAVDGALDVASFSSGGVNPEGGEVDIAAPGVGIFSSVPLPQKYRTLMGTSMACPHVAGVAALWAQSDPSLRGSALWSALQQNAKALALESRDVGSGLVQAPKTRGGQRQV